jgi:hypothetical protein
MGNRQFGGMGGQSRGGAASDEERAMQAMMATMQMQDYLNMYNSTTEKCFKKCVFNLRTPQLVEKEEVRCSPASPRCPFQNSLKISNLG